MAGAVNLGSINLNLYGSVALAAFLYWMGSRIMKGIPVFSKYCIPAPLVGGLVFAL